MSKSAFNVALFCKIQPTPGTDPVPVAGTNAILASKPVVNPLNAQKVKRNNIQAWMGNVGSVITAVYATLEFEVEWASSGAAGTPPGHGVLNRGCALAETIVAATSAAYAPISSAHELVTFYWNVDGIRHVMTDARGTVEWALNALGIPIKKYKFWGFYATPTDVAIPGGIVYSNVTDPLPVSKANTTTFTMHGFAGKVSALSMVLGNDVQYRNVPNSEEIRIVNRDPQGSITMELPDTVATKDWWTTIRNGVTGALAVTHGTTVGRICTLAAPKVQLTDMTYSEDQGIVMIQSALDFIPSSGNDEIVDTYR